MVERIVRHSIKSKLLLGGHREPILLEPLLLPNAELITTVLWWKVRAKRSRRLRLHESRTISPVHPRNCRTLALVTDIHHLPHLLMHASQIRVPALRSPEVRALCTTELRSEWNGEHRWAGMGRTPTRGGSVLSVWMVTS